MAKYQKLLEPLKIGKVELKNRFIMLPMTIEKVDNYHVTDDLVDFYEQRAKGGVGLIEIGSCYVCDCFGTEPKYHTTTGACGCWDDEFIPGYKRIADVCHPHGAKIAAQLQLCYEWRASGDDPLLSYAPSADVPSGPFVGMPEREYTKEEIAEVVKQYGQAARRCKEAGIDIIEIHAGIGYMVMRFLSKYSNHRTDEYGGSPENRARLLTEIIDEIHRTCGDDMPILIRISADDLMPDGNRIEDTLELIPIIEAHGVDAWSIQAGFHEAPRPVANQIVPEGEFIGLAKQCKTVTNKPVWPGTRINSLDMCDKVVNEGYGDAVGMARQFIADPATAGKVAAGHPEQVRPCIVCSRCLDNIFIGKPCQCSVNANVWQGVEVGLPEDHPADQKQHVVVVGAGPGGMEAARVAALRGHKVTVVDHSDRVGGLLNMAQVLNANIEPLVTYWQGEAKLHPNINVVLKQDVDVNYLKSLNPDQVILSPGGGIIPIDVPGIDGKNVVKSEDIKAMCNGKVPEGKGMLWKAAVAAIKAQGGTVGFMRMGLNMASGPTAIVGKRVVVVGGGFAGLEVAEAMCDNREITVIDPAKKLGNGIGIIDKNPTLNLLKKKGVKLMPLTELIEVTKKGAKVKNVETGEEQLLECDTVLTSVGVEANTKLYDEVVKVWPHAKLIGDATTPAGKVYRTLEAVKGGYEASMAI
ncbi:oxidoreductase [Adlercreutzia mucosicola]|uniref:oxidoreductase n=1 Tax=Adlercreutzia mucosicola TaxID=580026 RepID=UPI002B255B6C|nr:FAD-dependent oxidoreductase [Adlercreutzia mucosicola]MEB1814225.1 NAD(P)/FAD-dependent oxidoreductase [Adlercreutzia mucosicola]